MSERREEYTTADYNKLAKQAKQEAPTLELLDAIRAAGMPAPIREFWFAKSIKRKWAADLAYPDKMILIEVEGGLYTRGRHVRAVGYENDCEKYNWAQLLGYKVYRFTPGQIKSGDALTIILYAMGTEWFLR
jgi:very-short-patch-repair endonuclease